MELSTVRPITLLIAAMGGEGGGVLTSWIVNAARSCGLPVQATSIPGVAQRTGATTYYIEIWPEVLSVGATKPVLALAPAIGEIDILAATEYVETGRMIEAGYVTPDRTTLIASNHRVFTTHEKLAMGDGRADVAPIKKAIKERAKRAVVVDMREASSKSGAVINAVMLGAICGAGVLPITRNVFEDGIQAEGKAVEANLRGFKAGLDAATTRANSDEVTEASVAVHSALSHAISNDFPLAAHQTLIHATTRLIDYQDIAYATAYLEKLKPFAQGDQELLVSVGRNLAVRMAYEDVYRVAQVKAHPDRLMRIRKEARAQTGEPIKVREFFKPRLSEISDALPAGLGRWLQSLAERNPGLAQKSWPMLIETTSVSGYLRIRVLSGLRRIRRSTLRFKTEEQAITNWLAYVGKAMETSHKAAMQVSECSSLIKGYGDTHKRGVRSYSAIMNQLVVPAVTGDKFTDQLAGDIYAARTAALADPEGKNLMAVLEGMAA
ncbi:MAG: indolepyruvate oxidoreductase subunit beta family protein [Alphaproteobacteria bacterium]|nr:indolepyruvate oxidoreductase subunit beta family protein [Alphaproteobacteria bacterium]